jgi:hypothetical protein
VLILLDELDAGRLHDEVEIQGPLLIKVGTAAVVNLVRQMGLAVIGDKDGCTGSILGSG